MRCGAEHNHTHTQARAATISMKRSGACTYSVGSEEEEKVRGQVHASIVCVGGGVVALARSLSLTVTPEFMQRSSAGLSSSLSDAK